MIAFIDFFKRRPEYPRQLRLPRPSNYIVFKGASEERIEAEFDETGTRMKTLIVYTRQ